MTVDQLHLELQRMVGAGHYDLEIVVLTDESRREINRVSIDRDQKTVELVAD